MLKEFKRGNTFQTRDSPTSISDGGLMFILAVTMFYMCAIFMEEMVRQRVTGQGERSRRVRRDRKFRNHINSSS